MRDNDDIGDLRRRLAESQAMCEALRKGEVDAVIGEESVAILRMLEAERKLGEQRRDLERNNAELSQAYAALEKRTKELERANEELKSFSYAVSHDLRSPLRAIQSFITLLQKRHSDKLDGEAAEFVGRIGEATLTMNELIQETLELSLMSRIELVRSTVDLSAMAREILTPLQEAEPERQTEIIIEPHMITEASEKMVRRVLENLLVNAWKYTGEEQVTSIFFGRETQQEQPVFVVRDNGAGFNMEQADRLFTPFQRLHSDTDFEGTGIGLTIVQRIVHRHGGRIWGESGDDGGASFYFTFA